MTTTHTLTENATFPVAFVALIKNRTSCEVAIKEIMREKDALSHAGADHLRFLTQTLGGDEVLIVMMDMNRAKFSDDLLDSWKFITECEHVSGSFAALEQAISPHPRLCDENDASVFPWVKAETICKLRPKNAAAVRDVATWHAAVTGLKAEKEADYRLLHDNVWPGVVDAIGASNISRFDIFIIEFGDNQPYLFYQFLYTGMDFENDMAAQSGSPVNQRWWKFTDAWQQPLPQASAGSPWLDMNVL